MQPTVFIIVDNLRVGGIQRLALDEAYSLSRRGLYVRIITLEPRRPDDDICRIDNDFLDLYEDKIFISWIGENQSCLKLLLKEVKKYSPLLIISHSAKGIFFARIAIVVRRKLKRTKLIGFVHQLIPLSDSIQKTKRIIFFSFAGDLRASSKQFILELEKLRKTRIVFKIILRRLPWFDRMGIDLERLSHFQSQSHQVFGKDETALVFLSRVVGWKGFSTFYDLCLSTSPKVHKVVFTSPIYAESSELMRLTKLPFCHVLQHKGIAELSVSSRTVHIYPTNYGEKVEFPQNIGLNVLESLALGVPSLISVEKFWSWPELENSPLIATTDWTREHAHNRIRLLSSLDKSIKEIERERVLSLISIESHIDRLLNGVW